MPGITLKAKIAEHADKMENAVLTLQSGVEMVEILHEMNMDSESLLTAMLFPLVANRARRLGPNSGRFWS